ncbi:MAG TPA: hypothetical protein VHC49_07720 [Mycobacteriales bacterium]|nr:hypothetical protein [Mycobacteriales bacterium]
MLDDILGGLLKVLGRALYWVFAQVVSLAINAVSALRRSRRLRPYPRFCSRHELRYDAVHSSVLGGQDGPPFDRSHDGDAYGSVTAGIGTRQFTSFEYCFRLEGADFQIDRYLRVALVRLPGSLPPIQVGPESKLTGIFPGLAPLDVDVENHDFNRTYRVSVGKQTQDRRYAVDLLNPRGVEALMSVPPLHWRIRGNEIVAWWKPGGPRDTLRRVEALARLVDAIPGFVWADRTDTHRRTCQ